MTTTRDQFVREAYRYRDVPYRYAGNDLETGVDCSGFVNGLLRRFNLVPDKDHNCEMLFSHFASCQTNELQPGNLIFFRGVGWHVAIYVGKVKGVRTMIEVGGGLSTTYDLAEALTRDACVKLSPIARRKDQFAIVDPFMLGGPDGQE